MLQTPFLARRLRVAPPKEGAWRDIISACPTSRNKSTTMPSKMLWYGITNLCRHQGGRIDIFPVAFSKPLSEPLLEPHSRLGDKLVRVRVKHVFSVHSAVRKGLSGAYFGMKGNGCRRRV